LNKALQQKLSLNANTITTNCSTSETEIKEDNMELVSICCDFCFLLFFLFIDTHFFPIQMDLLPSVIEHCSSEKRVVFAGTDPGIVVTSTTIPRTLEEIFGNINCFQVISTEDDTITESVLDSFNVKQLPKPSKITAKQVNNVTFLKHQQKKCQQQQKNNVKKERDSAKKIGQGKLGKRN